MNVASTGLASVLGAISHEHARVGQGVSRPNAPRSAEPATTVQQTQRSFEQNVQHARAVQATEKNQSSQQQPNPNLPRGSLIDFKV